MKEEYKKYIKYSLIIIVCLIVFSWFMTKDYDQRKGVVTDWNNIQLGFNIFFEEGNTLFLHGDDWKLEEFLEDQDYPKKMTFIYHVWNDGNYGSCVGSQNWNHIMEIRDEYGTKIFERELWQE